MLKRGILKKKPYVRGDAYVQSLYEIIRGKVSSSDLTNALAAIKELPTLNNESVFVRNRHGVLIEIVGKKGSSKKLSVDYCRGTWYFDGNRLGKRKMKMVKAWYTEDMTDITSEAEMLKLWKKMEDFSNVL